ncbi:sentrin-specific protease 7 isoform 3-T4 [Liasis olivaceus]
MEGSGKSSSDLQNYRIPKKVSNTQPDDRHIQSPLSRFEEIHQWQHSFKGWASRSRNKKIQSNWKKKSYCNGDEGSVLGQPKVILTNILGTKTGRKYMQRHLLTNPKLSDANKLQSDEQPSSSITSLKSCQTISSQQSCILPKRYERYPKRSCEWKQSKDTELSNALQTLKKRDVLLDCSTKNKGLKAEKGQENSMNLSPCLRKSSCQNNESRKRRCDVFRNQWNEASPQKSLLKEHRTESVQSPGYQDSSKNHQNHMHNLQQENIRQPLESDCNETLNSTDLDITGCCPSKNYPNSSPKRKPHSFTNKDKSILPIVSSAVKEKGETLPLRKPLKKLEMNKEIAESSEPIVLSSDEEEEIAEPQDPETHFQTGKGHELENNDKEQETLLHLSENLSQYMTESKAKQVSADPLVLHSSADHSTISEQMPLALDIKFERLYFGQYKGAAAGYATFTTSCFTIPFEVAVNKKIELSIDSMHLKKFGLWTNKDLSDFGTVIFLWLSLDYMEQVENQLGTTILNKQVRGTKFIFIQLSQMLTEEEQVMLNRIIVEVSMKINSADLVDFLPWQQAIEEISNEENSFMHYCYNTCQKLLERNRTSVLAEQPPEEIKSNVNKPSYTLLQKQYSGQYSFSIYSVNRNGWNELQETGPTKNLIVYPPPPAKGGLGVTKEDLECLEYGEFLNDVIIDFYLKYLLLEKAPKELADRSHIFSSFFYKCLTRTEKNSEENPKLSIAQRRHRRVKRWTRYINIFNKDYIFVPVNEQSHWYIAVICFPWLEEVIYKDCEKQHLSQSYFQQFPGQPESSNGTVIKETVLDLSDIWCDTEELDINSNLHPEDEIQPGTLASELNSKVSKKFSGTLKIKKICKRPCILILDSLKASSVQNTVQVLREYLEAEWEAKCKTCRKFSKSTMADFCPRVPKQNNSSDCGIYLLQYVETFFQNPVVNFELPIHLEQWFPPHLVRSKREQIKDLILQLHFQQQSGSKS